MGQNQEAADAAGRKVFLLYPHSVVQEKMLDTLIMNGFETYTLRDYKKAFRIMEKFPGSILLINIDEGLPETDWELFIKGVQKNSKTKNTRLGIVSYNQDHDLMEKYLMDIGVQCGFIQLKLGLRESTEIILNALNANEAKGRRQHIRAFCEEGIHASLNYKDEDNGNLYQGKILDISASGLAVRIPGLPEKQENAKLKDVQLKLHGSLILTDLVLLAKRRDDRSVYIMLFDPSKLTFEAKQSIHRFIKRNLQSYIDQIMK